MYQNELNGTVGKIANPYYPNPFMHSENVEWRVTVDFGEAVRIAFKEIRLDDFFHVLCLSSVTVRRKLFVFITE